MIKAIDKSGENNLSVEQTKNFLQSSPTGSVPKNRRIDASINRLFLGSLQSPLSKYWLIDIEKGVVLFFWDDSYQHKDNKSFQKSDTLLYGEFFLALNNFTRKAMSQSLQHIRTQNLSLYLIKEKSYLHVFAMDRNSPLFMNHLKESRVKSYLSNFSKELSAHWENTHPFPVNNSLSSSELADHFAKHVLKIKEQLSSSFEH